MLAMGDCDQVRIVVNVFPERLWVAIVRTEPQRAIDKADEWNTRQARRDCKAVFGVARPKFIQDVGSKNVNVAKLEARGGGGGRILEAARYIGTIVELVSRAGPVELGEEAIVLTEVIVQPQGCFITVEKVLIHLRVAGVQHIHQKAAVAVEGAGVGRTVGRAPGATPAIHLV